MSAEPTSLLQYVPMAMHDLKRVIEVENQVYTHPWTLGNFRDSIQAGHRCVMLTYGDALIGYAVVLVAADEAHLLNLTIAAEWQRKGHGRAFLLHLMSIAVTGECICLVPRHSKVPRARRCSRNGPRSAICWRPP